jgi:hypothetical protein
MNAIPGLGAPPPSPLAAPDGHDEIDASPLGEALAEADARASPSLPRHPAPANAARIEDAKRSGG